LEALRRGLWLTLVVTCTALATWPALAESPADIEARLFTHIDPAAAEWTSGIATWYSRRLVGRRTTSGEPYRADALTAAHKTWPLGSHLIVRNPRNHREVAVRINDRGPQNPTLMIDLSQAAASALGILQRGSALVEVREAQPAEWAAFRVNRPHRKAKVRSRIQPARHKKTPAIRRPTPGKLKP
jgi:rare lipoprotein A